MECKFSYICFIYAEIFEKMLSGGLEVSFSIVCTEATPSLHVL